MSTDPRVSDLLLQWEEGFEQNRPVSVEELCRDCPHLLDELRRRVEALCAIGPLLQPVIEATLIKQTPPALSPAVPPPSLPWQLPTVPGYEILRELGRGGMGVVYLARQTSLGRLVALKMLLAGAYTSAEQRQRFHTEAEVVARLQHPNIVAVHDFGEVDGRAYFALEYVAGRNLAEALDGKPCPGRTAAELVARLADGVQAAHEVGVIHRDLKPANVLLSAVGADLQVCPEHAGRPGGLPPRADAVPKITDFGLAKRLEADSKLTESGDVMGTPCYMAPEQAAGLIGELGPATDVYSLGAILYETLTGRPPFLGATPLETMSQVLSDEPVPPRRLNPGVPRDLDTIALKALHKNPRNRYPSARALADDLRRFLDGEPILARPAGPIERLWRWCLKRPAVAALTAAVFLLLVATAAVSFVAYVRTSSALASEAEQREQAEAQRQAAVTAEGRAVDEAKQVRRLLYASDMRLAAELFKTEPGSTRRVAEILGRWDGTDGEDLRELAWRYLWGRLLDQSHLLPGHEGEIQRGAWRPDGKLVTIASNVLRCWDPQTGRLLNRVPLLEEGESARIDLAADGSTVALLQDGVVRVINATTGEVRRKADVPGKRANVVRLSPDGKHVLVRREADGMTWVWETAPGKPPRKNPSTDEMNSRYLALAPGGTHLASRAALGGAKVTVVELRENGKVAVTGQSGITLNCLAFSPDGKQLAAGDLAGKILLLNPAPLSRTSRLSVHLGPVNRLAYSRNGKLLASGSQQGAVAVTNLSTEETTFSSQGHVGPVTFVSLSPRGDRLASGGRDGTVRIWDLTPGGRAGLLREGEIGIQHLACSADGKWLATVQGPRARLWDRRAGRLVRQLAVAEKPRPRPSRVAFSPDSKTLAVGVEEGSVHLWDVETGRAAGVLKPGPGVPAGDTARWVTALAYSPDGRLIAAGYGALGGFGGRDYDQVAQVWDVASAQVIQTLPHRHAVRALCFSPSGSLLVSGCEDRKLRTWDVSTWQPGRTWVAGTARVYSLAVSPSGDLIAAGQGDGAIHVWEAESGKLLWASKEHVLRVEALAFAPDGKTLISAGEDHVVRLWHLASGRSLLTWRGHEDPVRGLAVTPDGETVVSGDNTGNIRLWQAPPFSRILREKAAK